MKPAKDLSHLDEHSLGEEIANSIIHGIGALLSVAALIILVVISVKMGDAWRVVSFSIYGFTLILLYTMSTLYHALTHLRAKRVFRIFDHLAQAQAGFFEGGRIFVVAGTSFYVAEATREKLVVGEGRETSNDRQIVP